MMGDRTKSRMPERERRVHHLEAQHGQPLWTSVACGGVVAICALLLILRLQHKQRDF